MAGIRAEEVNRPREARAYGLIPGIGDAYAIGWNLDFADENLRKSRLNGWRHAMASRLLWLAHGVSSHLIGTCRCPHTRMRKDWPVKSHTRTSVNKCELDDGGPAGDHGRA